MKPSINTAAGWNALAAKTNRETFFRVHGRCPDNARELKAWIDSFGTLKKKGEAS